jgi:hypothetical protein
MNPASPDARRHIRRTRLRKGLQGLHAGVGLILLAALWLMVNYLSFRTFRREDWSRQQLTALSEKTDAVLAGVSAPIRFIAYTGKEFRGRDELEDLLKEYSRRSSLLSVEWVDPDRDIAASKEIKTRFEIAENDQLIVVGPNRHVLVPLDAMLVHEADDTRKLGAEPRVIGFQGEAHITAALLRLSRIDRPVVYFLSGHGEKDPDLFEAVPEAYSDVRERLERDNVEIRKLSIEQSRAIPDDAAAVVVAGPRTRISQPEIDVLRAYLEANGRLLVMVNVLNDAGLEPLLRDWGIQLLPDMVVDPTRTLQGADLHVLEYSEHPITRGMKGIRSIFIRPRSILPAVGSEQKTPGRPHYRPLAGSTKEGWAELDLNTQPITFDPATDQRGPIPISATIEWAFPGAPAPRHPLGRIAIFGDSEFAGNWLRNGGGMLLFQNSVHWLLDTSELIAIPPKNIEEIRLQMDQSSLNTLLFQVAVLLPGAAAILGFFVFSRRRS